jgi:hypothetical protein
MFSPDRYLIRDAGPADAAALSRLAEVDSQRRPLAGPILIGEIDGTPAAAVALDDGRVIADPFRSTGHLAAHLRVRAHAASAYRGSPSLPERMLAALGPAFRPARASA